ncbi:metallophosphoesterase family protein [Roseateles sp. DXS20W]|uniref:Metallophosphoesterase family protein n=1 Tax=Pelomonas lactea TaxID=3299030 RepID=A0ABW7GEU3_9BURK
MTTVLQLSDPHFGTERRLAMDALQTFCAALRPDLLLVTGDITQRARTAEFDAARAFLDRLAVPERLVLPGNHDIPLFDLVERALHPYRRYARAFGAALEGEYERDDLLVLSVNTTRRWRHRHGEVSPAQVERVAQRLARARSGQLRLVAVHQPVAVTEDGDVENLLRGHPLAVQRWAQAGADAVVGGHIHLPYVLPLPGLARTLWAVQAGTALSHRLRGGISNSVNVIHAGPGARVERWDLDDASQSFRRVASTLLTAG